MSQVYSPASLELPPELRKYAVYNRYVPATGEYDRVKWKAWESIDSAALAVSDSCVFSFNAAFVESERFGTVYQPADRMFVHNGAQLPDPLPWDGLIKIAKNHYVDALIMLESFSMEELPPSADSENPKGTLRVSTGWRIYHPVRHRILDESVYTYDYPAEIGKVEAAKKAGQAYAKLVLPSFIELSRKYYTKGNQPIEEAAAFIAEGKWGKAESKWKYHTYNGETDEIKAMCSYNMALLSEKEGYLNKALGFARRAQKLMPAKLHVDVINEMNIRLFEIQEKYKTKQIIKNW